MKGSTYHLKSSYWVRCYISGPIEMVKQCCREFVLDGLCVTVTPTTYIYTHGEESGVMIELIRYPKYPNSPGSKKDNWNTMVELADFILDQTHQGSYTVMDAENAITFDRRRNAVKANDSQWEYSD